MNSVDTFKKELREEIATVEKEIQSNNQRGRGADQTTGGSKAGG
jgi:hypothetical protein